MKLARHVVAKPWGRRHLPPPFDTANASDAAIGEIWFAPTGASAALLIKYIFTRERLSVQVHPDDTAARALGFASGKSECWYVVDADPGATIGVGLRHAVDRAALRAASESGAIVDLLDWRPVIAGDFLHVPAGTIHAIGAGITLVEIQQNVDVTYRLYDYGRLRALHLDDGIAAADPVPFPADQFRSAGGPATTCLVVDPAFTVLRADRIDEAVAATTGRDRWVVPLSGIARSGADAAGAGDCLFLPAGEPLALDDATVLIAIA